ncbi:MAG TPA: hypothetical protein VM487_03160 [Phycisphaerae bacterium]|nr:hypothetical protein [Phycisphaerae bacterium]
MAEQFCSGCGATLEPGWVGCPKCGRGIKASRPAEQRRTTMQAFGCLLCVLGGLGMCTIFCGGVGVPLALLGFLVLVLGLMAHALG